MFVGDVVRLLQDGRALRAGVRHALVDVADLQGQVDHAVAVPAVVVEQGLSGATPPLMTKRAEPDLSTKDLWSF
ncbi:hypothetical protein GCM10029964_007350 [Kibdelosporangium lantanae]